MTQINGFLVNQKKKKNKRGIWRKCYKDKMAEGDKEFGFLSDNEAQVISKPGHNYF